MSNDKAEKETADFEIWRIYPLTIEKLHEDQLNCLIIEGTMLIDFGPWKQGEKRCLTFDLVMGRVIEYGEDGEPIAIVYMAPFKEETDQSDATTTRL